MDIFESEKLPINLEQDSVLHRITNRIRQSLELQDILTATVAEVRLLLGSDRVKIYKFHADGSGQVVAESIYANRLPSLIGLNFPAGDIPDYARQRFIQSKVRSVINVDSAEIGLSHLQELGNGETQADDVRYYPLDQCHVEYLTAMGVKSSVVVPIFHQERLWGLLVSHHTQARTVPNQELQILQSVVEQLSVAIAQSKHLMQTRQQAEREATLNRVGGFLHSDSSMELQLALEESVAAFQGSGGRLCIKKKLDDYTNILSNFNSCLFNNKVSIYTYGVQPKMPDFARYEIMEQYNVWKAHYQSRDYDIWAVSDIYKEDALRNLQPAFYTTKIRGLILIPLHYQQKLLGYLTIFRDEFETETLWAGRVENDQRQLYPQISFEVWRDTRKTETFQWSASELELARSLGNQFSTAIYQAEMHQQLQALNASLETQVQERTAKLQDAAADIQQAAERQRIIFEVVTKMRESLDLTTIFQTTTQETCKALQSDRVWVYRFNRDWGGEFVGDFEFTHLSWAEIRLGVNMVWDDTYLQKTQGGSYRQGEMLIINDVEKADFSPCHINILKQYEIKAFAIVPIFVGQKLWGLFGTYQYTKTRCWENSEVQFLTQIAAHLGVAIQQAELLTQTQQQTAELQQAAESLQRSAGQQRVLFEVVAKMRQSLNVETIFRTTTQETCKALQSDRVAVYRFNSEWGGEFAYDFEFTTPGWGSLAELGRNLNWNDTYLQETKGGRYRHGETFAVDNIYEVGHTPCHIEILEQFQIKAYAIAPIFVGQTLWGLLAAYQHAQKRNWRSSEVKFLSQIAAQLGVTIQQANLLNHTQTQTEQLTHALRDLQSTQTQLIQTEKMSSLGQLVAGVAHEINNPVSFIYGNLTHVIEYTENLLTVLKLYEKHHPQPHQEIVAITQALDIKFIAEDMPKILDSMQVGTERIRQIVESLRNFSRIDQSDMKKVDIREGIDNTLMILQHRLKPSTDRPGIEIVKQYENLPLIECYPGQLNQVFMNLLGNAIDALEKHYSQYTLPGQETPGRCISIRTYKLGQDYIGINITDNGIGMPKDVINRIFDPFFTTKAIGKGTGLGLSISYQIIVEKHHGNLKCISTPNEGTQFIIEIPVQQAV